MRAVLAGLATAVLGAAQAPTCNLVAGWTQQGAARAYDASNLYEYMDGNAEGYLIFDFVAMHGVTCVNGGDSILLDVSEFRDADLAYGIFGANRDPRLPAEAIGAGGQVTPRRGIFAKGSYYAELAASPEKDHTPALRAFAAALEKLLQGSSAAPAALAWFPAEGLNSVRLIPESALGLRLLKRGYAAQYDFGKAFVVAESSEESAAAVMDKLRAKFGASGDVLQTTDRYLGRLCFVRKGKYVVGYANVAEGRDPLVLATALAARLP